MPARVKLSARHGNV